MPSPLETLGNPMNRLLISVYGGSLVGLAIYGEQLKHPLLRIGAGLAGVAAVGAAVFVDSSNKNNEPPEDIDNRGDL